MRVSKLERYYQAEFGPRDDPGAPEPAPVRSRAPERMRGRRRGPGPVKLVLLLGGVGFLGASLLMPCGSGPGPVFLPQGLVAAVCARQAVMGHIRGLDDRFRSIAGALR